MEEIGGMAGWIGFYVDEPDIELFRERLNADLEIAFILPEGPGRWRAVWQVDEAQGQTMLWHVPGGPLPLLVPSAQDILIEDPFAGWQELEPGRDRTVPYFGPGWPATLLLKLFPPGWRGLPRHYIPVSGLGWYGRMLGTSSAPHPALVAALRCLGTAPLREGDPGRAAVRAPCRQSLRSRTLV
jgi:hypothetical protein